MKIQISAFYCFVPLDAQSIETMKLKLEDLAVRQNFRGLVLLGKEGINGTVSGDEAAINEAKELVRALVQNQNQVFKDSFADHHPFHELKVKVKKEIVTIGKPELVPKGTNHHLSPKEWNEMMEKDDVVVIDTRNTYEVKMGKFKDAVDLEISDFHDFPDRIKELDVPKDKKVLIYCTGGIRCEKAILEMQDQGFDEVYQLDGGILNYLKEYPGQKFEGDCFVFDYRVAVDQSLNPSNKYKLCPHCGQPAMTKITCIKCGSESLNCEECLNQSEDKRTCSKNCAHHARIASRSKRQQTEEYRRRLPS